MRGLIVSLFFCSSRIKCSGLQPLSFTHCFDLALDAQGTACRDFGGYLQNLCNDRLLFVQNLPDLAG